MGSAAPAALWTDALAIGNGRLGAMIFGGPEHDRLQLNDITVSSGGLGEALRGADLHAAAAKALEATASKSFDELKTAHIADYR